MPVAAWLLFSCRCAFEKTISSVAVGVCSVLVCGAPWAGARKVGGGMQWNKHLAHFPESCIIGAVAEADLGPC